MKLRTLVPILLAAAFAAPTAHATVELLAIGSLSPFGDLATQTAGALENGAPGNLFGGVGSALAYAGGATYLALPDRGPNAIPFNPLVSDTASYINRFQTLTLTLTPSSGGALPYTLTPTLGKTTLLSSPTPLVYGTGALGTDATHTLGSGAPALNTANTYYFTGRSDNFDPSLPSTNPNNGRLDPEGIRVSNDGKSVFVSDEYGPYVYQFDRATGQRIKSFALPSNLAITNLSANGDTEINHANNPVGRVANKGMEGLAITPDGKTLVGIMQAPLEQDTNGMVRIVTIDIASGTTHEYAYKLTTGSGVSEIVAINSTQFLVDERDGKGLGDNSSASVKQIFKIDIANATDVTNMSGDLSAAAVTKSSTPFIDVVALLKAQGIGVKDIPSKIEGMAFGEDVIVNGQTMHTLIVSNDNDFLSTITDSNHPAGIANPSNFYVFGFSDTDLPGFVPQALAVPEPSTYALMIGGVGVMGLMLRRRGHVS